MDTAKYRKYCTTIFNKCASIDDCYPNILKSLIAIQKKNQYKISVHFSIMYTWRVIALFLLCIQITYGAKRNLSYYDSIWKKKQAECKETIECRKYVPDEAMNCVNRCISEKCFGLVYEEPLEDGEIDIERQRKFTSCLRDELKKKKMK